MIPEDKQECIENYIVYALATKPGWAIEFQGYGNDFMAGYQIFARHSDEKFTLSLSKLAQTGYLGYPSASLLDKNGIRLPISFSNEKTMEIINIVKTLQSEKESSRLKEAFPSCFMESSV